MPYKLYTTGTLEMGCSQILQSQKLWRLAHQFNWHNSSDRLLSMSRVLVSSVNNRSCPWEYLLTRDSQSTRQRHYLRMQLPSAGNKPHPTCSQHEDSSGSWKGYRSLSPRLLIQRQYTTQTIQYTDNTQTIQYTDNTIHRQYNTQTIQYTESTIYREYNSHAIQHTYNTIHIQYHTETIQHTQYTTYNH